MPKGRAMAVVLSVLFLVACRRESPEATSAAAPASPPAPARAGPKNAAGIFYVPIDPKVYVPGATITQWATQFDDAAISNHAWDLWAGLNADSGEQYCADWQPQRCVDLPVWDTWFSEFEVFKLNPQGPPQSAAAASASAVATPPAGDASMTRPWHLPRQIGTRSLVVSFNKYNLEFKDFVEVNKYYKPATLEALVTKFNQQNTPIEQRLIAHPPEKGIMLKPTFWVMYADKPSPVPYWQGPGVTIAGTTYPERPTDLTWQNVVLVDPTGQAKNDQDITRTLVTRTGTTQWVNKAGTYPVVPLDAFYYVPLAKKDVEYLLYRNAFQVGGTHPELGGIDLSKVTPTDHLVALLVGMHVTTAERPDYWTFQTFFWTPNAKVHKGLKPPFTNFDSVQAYYMVGKDGKPHIAFNPHLEPPIEGPLFLDQRQRGSHSNCMSCHRAAAWPSLGNNTNNPLFSSYLAVGNLQRDNPVWFSNRVQTLNMWTLVIANLQGHQAPSDTPSNPGAAQ